MLAGVVSDDDSAFKSIINTAISVIIRVIYIGQIVFCIYSLCIISTDLNYIYMVFGILFIMIDGLFVCVKRKGIDYKWYY